jgi:Cdc6-like AAA superfamily ATPase
MDPLRNPCAVGDGRKPHEQACRDSILELARISFGRALRVRSTQSILLLGLQGTGKTILLNEIGQLEVKSITQERVIAVCIAGCSDMKRGDEASR